MRRLKNKVKIFVTACILGFVSLSVSGNTVYATQNLVPKAIDNLQVSLRAKSELVATDSGYMRVYYDGEKIGIENYDNDFNILSKDTLEMELDIWGGFYAGKDGYYLVEGCNNTAENDAAEIIRVIKYDKKWKRLGAARITSNPDLFGGEVRYPFDYGCVEMAEINNTLYIVTGHEGYVDSNYNQGHQGFLMLAVDKTSMTGNIVDCDYWHSFAQYIKSKDSNLYVLELSEGSRYTKLSKYNAKDLSSSSISVLGYGGTHDSAWAIKCYASVDGMELSSGNVLGLGTSIDQSKYDEVTSDTPHNMYLTVTPMSNFTKEATTVKWLTNYTGGGKSFLGTKITKINDNRFMISWEESDEAGTANVDDALSGSILHYVFIDGNGNKISTEYTAKAPISDCQPIVKNGKVAYHASSSNMVNFYMIDSQSGAFTKKTYRVAGDNATWEVKDGVLTISGTSAVNVDTEANYRYPVSSTAGYYTYSSGDNSWKPIRDAVEKIVIKSGITGIAENAFAGFSNLTEVVIESGLKSIGAKAFYGCGSLEKISIPSTVVEIGEDFLWTGYYWTSDESHVVRATIYAPENSYAAKYAKEQGISITIDNSVDTIKYSSVDNDSTSESVTNVKKPKRVKITKLTSSKKKTIKIKWKRNNKASGYHIQIARNAKFTKNKKIIKIKKNKITSKIIKKLSSGKKYYVRIRAYKNVDAKKLYGKWSKVKKIKCK